MKLFVEGGGDVAPLKAACRAGFKGFLIAAGLPSRPRIIPCGTRRNAYEQFRRAKELGETAFLLVDSEAPVARENQTGGPEEWRPWHHLKARPGDGWDKPAGSEERHCHLMVQCMESWFLADSVTLSRFFGGGFVPGALPKAKGVESIDKSAIYAGLAGATKACRTGRYGKGRHSFKLLALIDPAKVAGASPWAARFIAALNAAMDP